MVDVETRIRGVLAKLDAMPDTRVAIVTHGYWILLMSLIVPGRLRLRFLTNCAVTRVDADGLGGYRLR
jgi:broad specificity phosphatase PhoE